MCIFGQHKVQWLLTLGRQTGDRRTLFWWACIAPQQHEQQLQMA